LLPALASTVILGSDFHETHDKFYFLTPLGVLEGGRGRKYIRRIGECEVIVVREKEHF
jgi:hypothetical protein